jgi:hypothetical protein
MLLAGRENQNVRFTCFHVFAAMCAKSLFRFTAVHAPMH